MKRIKQGSEVLWHKAMGTVTINYTETIKKQYKCKSMTLIALSITVTIKKQLLLSIRLLDILVAAMKGIISPIHITVITQNVMDTRIFKKGCTKIKHKICKNDLFAYKQRFLS